VQVNFDDARCFGNVASRGVPEAAWRKLEAPLTGGGDSSVGPSRHLGRTYIQRLHLSDTATPSDVPLIGKNAALLKGGM
jgi:hypothetical protein